MTWLRSALFNLWFYGVTVCFAVAGTGVRLAAPRHALAFAQLWARTVLIGLWPICRIRIDIYGREHLPTGAALIASQHQSAFDTLVWLLLVPRTAYVFKRELLRIPLFGGMCQASGMIMVDREAGGTAIRAMLRDADRAVADQRQIVIFPEGTRMPPGVRGTLHPGVAALASRTRLPVLPVTTDSGTCWGRRAFRKQPGVIRVVLHPPLPEGLGRAALMQHLDQIFSERIAAEPVDKSVGWTFHPLSASHRNNR